MHSKNIESFILDNNEKYKVEIFKDARGQWKDLKKFLLNHHDDLIGFKPKMFCNDMYYTLIFETNDTFWCVRYFKEMRTLAKFIKKCMNDGYNEENYYAIIGIFHGGIEQPFVIGIEFDYNKYALQKSGNLYNGYIDP